RPTAPGGAVPSTAAGRARAAGQLQQPDLGIERRLGLRVALLRADAELFRVHHAESNASDPAAVAGVGPPPIGASISEPPVGRHHSAGARFRPSKVGDRTDSYSRYGRMMESSSAAILSHCVADHSPAESGLSGGASLRTPTRNGARHADHLIPQWRGLRPRDYACPRRFVPA